MNWEHSPPNIMSGMIYTSPKSNSWAGIVIFPLDFRQRPTSTHQTIDRDFPRPIDKSYIGTIRFLCRRVQRWNPLVGFTVVSDRDPSRWPTKDLGEEVIDLRNRCEQVSKRTNHVGRQDVEISH